MCLWTLFWFKLLCKVITHKLFSLACNLKVFFKGSSIYGEGKVENVV
jgi:hypothetical protein